MLIDQATVPLALVSVAPIGTHSGLGFARQADGCRLATIESPTYPADTVRDGRVLAIFRSETCNLSLRCAAALSGLTSGQVSDLERGAARFATPEDRIRYVAALDEARKGR